MYLNDINCLLPYCRLCYYLVHWDQFMQAPVVTFLRKLKIFVYVLTWTVFKKNALCGLGFCHNGPPSLCIDLFLFICVFCFVLHCCCIIVSTVMWTWWDWSLILTTYLPSVLWHCWLGRKNQFPGMTCNVFGSTLNLAQPTIFLWTSCFVSVHCRALELRWTTVGVLVWILFCISHVFFSLLVILLVSISVYFTWLLWTNFFVLLQSIAWKYSSMNSVCSLSSRTLKLTCSLT